MPAPFLFPIPAADDGSVGAFFSCKYDEDDSRNQDRYTNYKFHHPDALGIVLVFTACFEISFEAIDEIILFPEVYKIPEQNKRQSQQDGQYFQNNHS